MGTALIEAGSEVVIGNSPAEVDGVVSAVATHVASACHSFGEGGRDVGVTGALLSLDFAQQARVQQCVFCKPQHLQPTDAVRGTTSAEAAKTLCKTVPTQTKMARSIVTVLEKRIGIEFVINVSFRCRV